MMGNKRKLDIITISSDDDDDDIPLKLLGTPSPLTTTNGLKTYCVQQCEFCDKVFLNKYDLLIHNAKHIIIPLLKESAHRCAECLFCFISRKELKLHMKHTHNMKLTTIDNNVKTKHEKKEVKPILKLKDITIDIVDVKYMKDDLVKAKDQKKDVAIENKIRNDLLKTKDQKKDEATENKIRNRLRFEDEDDITDCTDIVDTSVVLLNDLTKECKVNMNLFDKPWVDAEVSDTNKMVVVTATEVNDMIRSKTKADAVETSNDVLNVVVTATEVNDMIMSKTKADAVETSNDVLNVNMITAHTEVDTIEPSNDEVNEYTASTHFDELVKPGMFRCKRCQQIFGTRFQLIQHDMQHVKIRKPRPLLCEFCERFISNSRLQLKEHLMKHSPDLWNHKQRMHTTCNKCGLKYHSYKKHLENYHDLVYCHLCYKGFDTDEERLDHIREHLVETKCMQCDLVSTAIEIAEHQRVCHRVSNVSTTQICETCCLFVKNKFTMQYVFLQNISEIGTRLTCDRCNKKFFELKLVRRLHKAGFKERDGEREKKKCLSNTERLKNIQQRLKMINKLSRF